MRSIDKKTIKKKDSVDFSILPFREACIILDIERCYDQICIHSCELGSVTLQISVVFPPLYSEKMSKGGKPVLIFKIKAHQVLKNVKFNNSTSSCHRSPNNLHCHKHTHRYRETY